MPATLIDRTTHRRKLIAIQNKIIFKLKKLQEQTDIVKFTLNGNEYEATDLELRILFKKAVKSISTKPATHLNITDFESWFIENHCKEEEGYAIEND